MDIELRLVRSFVTTVEEGHVGRAAQRLYLSQPALSKQLQRLEAFLGVELFDRVDRTLRLTTTGLAFFHDAQELLAHASDVTDRSRALARTDAGRVTVAFVAGLVEIASALLRTADKGRPGLDLTLLRVDWLAQTTVLHSREADLSLVRLPIDERGIEYRVLLREPRVAGLARGHPLAGRSTLSIRELDAEPIIRTGNQMDYWSVNPRPSGATPILGPLANTVEEMLAVVAADQCMCITAESLARAYLRQDIVWIPIPDISPSAVALAWLGERPPALTQEIVQLARRAARAISAVYAAEPTATQS